jgi:hypothetical protein
MSNNNKIPQTNINKRAFLKTLGLSLAFLSFGGLGSILKSFLIKEQEVPKSGYGSKGYGL